MLLLNLLKLLFFDTTPWLFKFDKISKLKIFINTFLFNYYTKLNDIKEDHEKLYWSIIRNWIFLPLISITIDITLLNFVQSKEAVYSRYMWCLLFFGGTIFSSYSITNLLKKIGGLAKYLGIIILLAIGLTFIFFKSKGVEFSLQQFGLGLVSFFFNKNEIMPILEMFLLISFVAFILPYVYYQTLRFIILKAVNKTIIKQDKNLPFKSIIWLLNMHLVPILLFVWKP